MKKAPPATRATDSAESVPVKPRKTTVERLDLSPERIAKGASTQTEVLTQILERQQQNYHFRHWGINE